jgi:hypothetical protein
VLNTNIELVRDLYYCNITLLSYSSTLSHSYFSDLITQPYMHVHRIPLFQAACVLVHPIQEEANSTIGTGCVCHVGF